MRTSGLSGKHAMRGGEKHGGAALAFSDKRFHVMDGAAEREGLAAFGRREVSVARAEREAVSVAHDGAHDDFGGEQQIGSHAPQDCNLRCVFLAEVGAVGLGGDEQLGDNGGHAAKMAGAGLAVETIAECGNFDKCVDIAGPWG